MARGGYFIGVKGVDEFAAALKASGGEMKELRAVHLRIGKLAETNVQRNVPVYGGSAKDSGSHKGPGYLRSIVKGGGSAQRSWVQMKDESGVLILQEFGGTSFWHSSGRGAIRALNRGHRKIAEVAARTGVGGHVVYKKPRKPRGYFIWNVAYHMRREIGTEYCQGMKQVAEAHGLVFDVAVSPALDIKPDSWGG